jgi:hypothetical protein
MAKVRDRASTACSVVDVLGGRFSRELGIDLDRGGDAPDRWFLAATLFGTRISAQVAVRTYGVLAAAGVTTVRAAGRRTWDDLVQLLDEGGYARYDFRTASRLHELSHALADRYGGSIAPLAAITEPRALESALDDLPGWGPTTVRVFLRELRDVWPGAQLDLDDRVRWSAGHLGLALPRGRTAALARLEAIAADARVDARDLEAALVRLALAHRHGLQASCRGGPQCRVLATRGHTAAGLS